MYFLAVLEWPLSPITSITVLTPINLRGSGGYGVCVEVCTLDLCCDMNFGETRRNLVREYTASTHPNKFDCVRKLYANRTTIPSVSCLKNI